ncbi:MAG TPA: FAD-dependent oxidoreductase, partial [Acidimicrobiales bacterium]|nr:FAD-dependent oxidoreductase [Acidimicrobiales bacterium]
DERFGYVSGGYATTLRALGGRLAELGVEVRTASRVERVVRQGDDLVVTAAGSPASDERVDRVVVTAPPPVAAGLCPDLSEAERSRWAAVRYQGVTCTSVLLRRPLAGYYLTYLMDPAPFTTVVEMTSLIDPSEVGGHSLVYLPRYMASDDPEFGTADAAWEATALEGLKAVYPGVADDDVLAVRTARARMVFPLPVLGYARDVLPAGTSVPGLHLVSSAQIVNGTLNANETIGLANRSAELLVAS